jgi:hypothetical protein
LRHIIAVKTTYKIISSTVLSRLTPYADEIIGDHQCGFQCNRWTDQIFCIRQILEKRWEYNGTVHQLFIDSKKSRKSVGREVLHTILIEFGVTTILVDRFVVVVKTDADALTDTILS